MQIVKKNKSSWCCCMKEDDFEKVATTQMMLRMDIRRWVKRGLQADTLPEEYPVFDKVKGFKLC